jgi:hypothetical protein
MDSLPGYDAWKTAAPEDDWGICPDCGCSQEDCEELPSGEFLCPECACVFCEDDAHPDYSDMFSEDDPREDR